MTAVIIILLLAVTAALGYVLWRYLSADKYISVKDDYDKEQKIYISRKGVNLDSGSLGGGTGELFRGTSKEKMDTIVMSQELAGARSAKLEKCTICLQNLKTKNRFQGNFWSEIILGRAVLADFEKSSLMLPFPSISRIHCRIFWAGGQMYVEDLGSSYGTYVNGIKAVQATAIGIGDELTIGYEKFRIER